MNSSGLSPNDRSIVARFAKTKMPSLKFISLIIAFLFLASAALAGQSAAFAQSSNASSSSLSNTSSNLRLPQSDYVGPRAPGSYEPLYKLLGKPDQIPDNYFAYSPSEISQMYNSLPLLNSGITGKGYTIAIVDAYGDPYIVTELHQFDSIFGLPNPPSFNVICIDGPCNYNLGIQTGWDVEIALDVEWSHAMAPGANINLYISSTAQLTDPMSDAELAAVLGANGGPPSMSGGIGTPGVYHNNIISNSWGDAENDWLFSQSFNNQFDYYGYPWIDQVFQEAAARDITVFVSSGDDGAFSQGAFQSLQYGGLGTPNDDPFVTAVGGTSLYMRTYSGSLSFPPADAQGTYGYETAWSWNNNFGTYQAGSTGGYSSFFQQPAYEHGPGIPDNGLRGNPDVSWDADPYTGVAIYLDLGGSNQGIINIGGTSVGSPSWAGVQALLDQYAGRSLGFMNPTFYSILNNPWEYSRAFHDVTVGNNDPYSATLGWNPVTGIGSPNIANLAQIVAGDSSHASLLVTNNLQQQPVQPDTPTPAYNYGDTVTLTASVVNGQQQPMPYELFATLTSQTGAVIASNIPMTQQGFGGKYVGTYTIQATDPPGEWMAVVSSNYGPSSSNYGPGSSLIGYNEFQVGDSIYILSPISTVFYTEDLANQGNLFEVGNTIPLAMNVENSANTANITSGTYKATFYLGSPSGKLEGTASLKYNSADELWEGGFTIPSTAGQGLWVVVFSGTDGQGNQAATAYSWVDVGLFMWTYTDSVTYLLGETMTIYGLIDSSSSPPTITCYQYYEGSPCGSTQTTTTGTFTATVSYGSSVLGTTPLSYDSSLGVWSGTFKIPSNGPTGFYTVTISGKDGMGDSGSQSEVVRVAPYTMSVSLSLSSSTVKLNRGTEQISVKITNGNGQSVDIGTVQAEPYIMTSSGPSYPLSPSSNYQYGLPLTYNAATGSWIGTLQTTGPPNWLQGTYTVVITAWDPIGDYGTATGTFTVTS